MKEACQMNWVKRLGLYSCLKAMLLYPGLMASPTETMTGSKGRTTNKHRNKTGPQRVEKGNTDWDAAPRKLNWSLSLSDSQHP